MSNCFYSTSNCKIDLNWKEITTITLQVALQLSTGDTFNDIRRFCEEAVSNEFTEFTHVNFFYSYPTFGKSFHFIE